MVFTLADSTAAFGGGMFLSIFAFVFVRARIGSSTLADGTEAFLAPADASFVLTLPSLLFLCSFTQFVDLNAHRTDLGWQQLLTKPELNGVLSYVVVACMPAALCLSTAMSLQRDGGVAILLYGTAIATVLHLVGSLALDAPLSAWATVEVVPARFRGERIWAVVHGGFGVRDDQDGLRLFGGGARATVFFIGLFLGTCGHLYLSLDYLWRPRTDCESDLRWCETIGWSTGVGMIVSWLALLVAALIAAYGNIANHTVSLWTRFALFGNLAHGLILLRDQLVGVYLLYLALGFGIWFSLYALTACIEPKTRPDDPKVARQ